MLQNFIVGLPANKRINRAMLELSDLSPKTTFCYTPSFSDMTAVIHCLVHSSPIADRAKINTTHDVDNCPEETLEDPYPLTRRVVACALASNIFERNILTRAKQLYEFISNVELKSHFERSHCGKVQLGKSGF